MEICFFPGKFLILRLADRIQVYGIPIFRVTVSLSNHNAVFSLLAADLEIRFGHCFFCRHLMIFHCLCKKLLKLFALFLTDTGDFGICIKRIPVHHNVPHSKIQRYRHRKEQEHAGT